MTTLSGYAGEICEEKAGAVCALEEGRLAGFEDACFGAVGNGRTSGSIGD
ncbi:MAG TPA: hypothetical protein VLT36_02485 [Candidatus Dormibacteraeota bacterium]|nr:hypothetical protein [Candidatus Dormibacteraeota bacterium]